MAIKSVEAEDGLMRSNMVLSFSDDPTSLISLSILALLDRSTSSLFGGKLLRFPGAGPPGRVGGVEKRKRVKFDQGHTFDGHYYQTLRIAK